jgi:hypothetical protein
MSRPDSFEVIVICRFCVVTQSNDFYLFYLSSSCFFTELLQLEKEIIKAYAQEYFNAEKIIADKNEQPIRRAYDSSEHEEIESNEQSKKYFYVAQKKEDCTFFWLNSRLEELRQLEQIARNTTILNYKSSSEVPNLSAFANWYWKNIQ